MKLPDMPSAVVSALFFVVVFLAEMFLGRETVAEVFRQISVIASLVASVATALLRLWQEYQAMQKQPRALDDSSSLIRRWLWG